MDDASKFTELQIKLLEKIKNGEITLYHLEWFIKLSPALSDTLMKIDLAGEFVLDMSTTKGGKLELIADFGVIKIPADYDHFGAADYSKKYFTYIQKDRPSAADVMHAGENIRIKVYKVLSFDDTTVEEIKKQPEFEKAIEAGVQGAVLVVQQKGVELMRALETNGIWGCVSFGKKITDTIYAYLDIKGCHIVDYANDNFRLYSTSQHAVLCIEPADEENKSQEPDTKKETNENSVDEESVKETKPPKPWEL